MSYARMALIALLVVLGSALASPAAGQAPPPCGVSTPWGSYASITDALSAASSLGITGGTVAVSGVCSEPEISIGGFFMGLSLVGIPGSQATLEGTSPPPGGTLGITGRSIVVRGLRIIPAAPVGARYGVSVGRGGTALIDGCVIEGFAAGAITVNQQAFARIVNNTLQNNGEEGILVSESSAVRVGFGSTDDLATRPNIIRGNILAGIRVTRTSNARITDNDISDNGEAGIAVENNSHADIAMNDLNGNHGPGIRVHLNSSARLGLGAGKAEWNLPNRTAKGTPNLGAGLECTLGGAVEGTLGTLTGVHGPRRFGHGCMQDLTH